MGDGKWQNALNGADLGVGRELKFFFIEYGKDKHEEQEKNY